MSFDPLFIGHRGILRGVKCVCGQWWPDFVRTPEHAEQFRTECCGSLYQLISGQGTLQTLSLVEDQSKRSAQCSVISDEPATGEEGES
jgi:hypothetical protein